MSGKKFLQDHEYLSRLQQLHTAMIFLFFELPDSKQAYSIDEYEELKNKAQENLLEKEENFFKYLKDNYSAKEIQSRINEILEENPLIRTFEHIRNLANIEIEKLKESLIFDFGKENTELEEFMVIEESQKKLTSIIDPEGAKRQEQLFEAKQEYKIQDITETIPALINAIMADNHLNPNLKNESLLTDFILQWISFVNRRAKLDCICLKKETLLPPIPEEAIWLELFHEECLVDSELPALTREEVLQLLQALARTKFYEITNNRMLLSNDLVIII